MAFAFSLQRGESAHHIDTHISFARNTTDPEIKLGPYRLVDSSVSPTSRAPGLATVVICGFYVGELRNPPLGTKTCTFPDGSSSPLRGMSRNWNSDSGRECYVCDVKIALLTPARPTFPVSLMTPMGNTMVYANTWPWHERDKKYKIANTCMVRDISCGPGLDFAGNCFRDWLEWNLIQGVEHFFIYNDRTEVRSMWLDIVHPYVTKGLVTVIDWPHYLGGPSNNRGQFLQMSHSRLLFSARVDWLGFFDVDEFFYLNRSQHSDATVLFDEVVRDKNLQNKTLTVKIGMHNTHHPWACVPTETAKSRITACLWYHRIINGHTKVFWHTKPGEDVIMVNTPHNSYPWQGAEVSIPHPAAKFLHFAHHFGCKGPTDMDCYVERGIAESAEGKRLEARLKEIETCGPFNPECI